MAADLGVACIVPTRNGADHAHALWRALERQTLQPQQVLVIDSESSDGTADAYRALGATVVGVAADSFGHGRTRNLAVDKTTEDVVVFLTQDAIPAHGEWLERLVAPLSTPGVAAAFSRQLPRVDASPLERFARGWNYPDASRNVTDADIAGLGLRAFFFSNSASAIRRDAFEQQGGFPTHTIMNEDMVLCARLLRAGWTVAYVAESEVIHSHAYGLAATFRRYFDIGVVFEQAAEDLGAGMHRSGGVAYARELLRWLAREGRWAWLPAAMAESAAKAAGVRLGRLHRSLPRWLKSRLSMHASYWR